VYDPLVALEPRSLFVLCASKAHVSRFEIFLPDFDVGVVEEILLEFLELSVIEL